MRMISIIVPIYNVEDYLHECIDSILSQSYTDIELILIDDGSTDRSAAIADKYATKDDRVKVIHKKNQGVSTARNTGLGMATGEYVTFIDADDYVRSDFIGNLVDDMLRFNVPIVTTAKAHALREDVVDDTLEVISSGDAAERMFYGSLERSDNGVQLFDRKLLIDNEILFNTKKKIGEDFDFFVRALEKTEKIAIDYRTMYFYRPNPTSAMNQNINKELMASVSDFAALGESVIDKWSNLRLATDTKVFSDSVSLQIRSYHVREEWEVNYKKLEYNTRSLKWSVLVNKLARKKVRMAASLYCILGNKLAVITLRRIKK